ncbi:MAG: hypothetical protein M1820_010042, partial [Bogoriella megaspora]
PETASLLAPSIDLTQGSNNAQRSSKISSLRRSSLSTSINRYSLVSQNSYSRRSLFSNASNSDNLTSGLLSLPVEIRLKILRYVLPSNRGLPYYRIYTDCDSRLFRGTSKSRSASSRSANLYSHTVYSSPYYNPRPHPPTRKRRDRLAILRVNHQIYYECLSLLYSERLFHFVGTAYLPVLEFFRRLGLDACEAIRKVRLTLVSPQFGGGPAGLDGCSKERGSMTAMGQCTGNGGLTGQGLDRLCREIHDRLPGLEVLETDPWVWM